MKRLYILISRDLDPIYGGVQGGHGVSQWLLEHTEQTWNNGYLIYLVADLEKWVKKLKIKEKDFSIFKEPDLNDKVTAVALLDDGRIFRNLKKLGF